MLNTLLSVMVTVSVSGSSCFSLTHSPEAAKTNHTINMCTPWTMTSLVRRRVRDWASCFLACRLPLDDHELPSSPRVAVRNMAFDKRKDNGVKPIYNNNLSKPSKKCNKKRHLNNPVEKDKDGVPIGNRFDNSSWSLSADEDYIVFCFREDGAFDVVKDGKGVKSEGFRGLDGKDKNSRPVNRKLKYDGDARKASDQNMHETRSNANPQDAEHRVRGCITPSKEDEEKERMYMGKQQHRDSIRSPREIEGIEERGVVSPESRDSDQSEGSTGSFAFPVLGWEWVGSPAQMPKSEGLRLRKQKVRSLRFHCCRF